MQSCAQSRVSFGRENQFPKRSRAQNKPQIIWKQLRVLSSSCPPKWVVWSKLYSNQKPEAWSVLFTFVTWLPDQRITTSPATRWPVMLIGQQKFCVMLTNCVLYIPTHASTFFCVAGDYFFWSNWHTRSQTVLPPVAEEKHQQPLSTYNYASQRRWIAITDYALWLTHIWTGLP